MEKFDRLCAEWMLETIETMKYVHPIPKPDDLVAIEEERARGVYKPIKADFWKQEHIAEYLAGKDIVARNSGNVWWLRWMRTQIPIENEVAHEKINAMLRSHGVGK
jgi:hypothetical protein